jgi:hypothetical protein
VFSLTPLIACAYIHILAHQPIYVDLELYSITFVNNFINSFKALEDRVRVRQQFLDLEMTEVLANVRGWAEDKGEEGDERYDEFIINVDTFADSMEEDQKQASMDDLDLTDIDSVFEFLRDQVRTMLNASIFNTMARLCFNHAIFNHDCSLLSINTCLRVYSIKQLTLHSLIHSFLLLGARQWLLAATAIDSAPIANHSRQ